jgi:hypothetical protein
MAAVAGEILVDGVEMKEAMSFRIQLFQLVAAALRQDRVA